MKSLQLKALFFVIAIVWSFVQFLAVIRASPLSTYFDSSMTAAELSFIGYSSVLVMGFVVVWRSVRYVSASSGVTKFRHSLALIRHREVMLASTLSLVPQASVSATTTAPDAGLPLRSVLQPAIAVALLGRLIRRQNDFFGSANIENRLTETSALAIHDLRRFAVEAHRQGVQAQEISDEEMDRHLGKLVSLEPRCHEVVTEWDVIVRMYGHPYVEGRNGERATFAKTRSLEVLAWLSMNLERPRRSAVRTAVWDIEISDASFSTVMSDIRRGVSAVTAARERKDIFPPTFTDSIEVGIALLTDFDLLKTALDMFRQDHRTVNQLAHELSLIRDIPFAGVNYMWADLDGTTTRMVLLALEASCELARWARDNNNASLCTIAVKAGLRVMPGDEELLAIQHSFISQRPMYSR